MCLEEQGELGRGDRKVRPWTRSQLVGNRPETRLRPFWFRLQCRRHFTSARMGEPQQRADFRSGLAERANDIDRLPCASESMTSSGTPGKRP